MRTLLYVPMIHQEWECNTKYDPGHRALTEEQAVRKEELLLKYWKYVSKKLLDEVASRGLIHADITIDLDLFCEAWTSERTMKSILALMADRAEYGDPMSSLITSMQQFSVRMHATESRFAYDMEGVFSPIRYRFDSLRIFMQNLRDRGIAAKLNRSVKENGTAVLFIGAGHDVPAFLNSEWNVRVITTIEILYIVRAMDSDPKRWVEICLKDNNLTDDDIRIDASQYAAESG